MNTVADRIKMELPWKDKIAYLLLFLFPVAGMSVRHWISAIFTFLVLLSFFYLSKKAAPLLKEEKIMLFILGGFFAVFIVSALLNGWTERQTHYLGVEIRYLLAIPMYLMVRQLPQAGTWILRGCVIGGMVLAVQTFYDLEVLNWSRATGIYSPNLLGPFAVLVCYWLLAKFSDKDISTYRRVFIASSFFCALYALLLSGSRGAYVGFLLISIIFFSFFYSGRNRIIFLGGILIFIMSAYCCLSGMSDRINVAFNEVQSIGETGDKKSLGAIEARLELWKAAILLVKEKPILGIGRGNYEVLVPEYVETGDINRAVIAHGVGHPHNAFLEVLVSKGSIGLIIFLMMLIYPSYHFIKVNKFSPQISMLGLSLIAGFSSFSITDASTFIKGNFTSIFLLFLVVFFSLNMKLLADQRVVINH